MHHYYYNCYLFLPPFLLGIVIVSLFDLSERGGLIKALGYSVIGLIFGLYLVLINRNLEYYSGKLFEPTATLEHAREVAEIIENDRGWEKHIEVLVHERRRHRKNAIYHLLSGQNFRRMQYSGYFKELRTKPEFAKTPAKILYLLTCPKPGPKKKAKTMLNLSKNWKFQYEISLTCSTCGNCELNRFATNLVLDRKLHH
ncbi:MAG: hypothetical protein R3A13_02700 [Bdellovibrionota bacterium]